MRERGAHPYRTICFQPTVVDWVVARSIDGKMLARWNQGSIVSVQRPTGVVCNLAMATIVSSMACLNSPEIASAHIPTERMQNSMSNAIPTQASALAELGIPPCEPPYCH